MATVAALFFSNNRATRPLEERSHRCFLSTIFVQLDATINGVDPKSNLCILLFHTVFQI